MNETDHVRELYRRIYQVIRKIPRGRVATYGQVAELAGIPGGARIAGAALKVSKGSHGLPWQRVIGKASRLRGRIAILDPIGAAIQRQLLEKEGVEVGESGLVALERYGWLPGGNRQVRRRSKPSVRIASTSTRSASSATRAESSRGASPRRPLRSGSKRRASSSRR